MRLQLKPNGCCGTCYHIPSRKATLDPNPSEWHAKNWSLSNLDQRLQYLDILQNANNDKFRFCSNYICIKVKKSNCKLGFVCHNNSIFGQRSGVSVAFYYQPGALTTAMTIPVFARNPLKLCFNTSILLHDRTMPYSILVMPYNQTCQK